ncbi:efflux RND transporter periplasmic adaptor subunit [Bacillus sp. 1P06AnD]|uniref:efflux RND transporter periplasmic adaptor subunit n=1 Tax=Bacillus sp. 1P06AnD TaxID=3132208 RepID=UPI0039A029E1
MKKWIFISVIIILIIGGSSWFLLQKKQENAEGDERNTQTATVKKGKLEIAVSGSGSIAAATDQDVTAANTVLPIKSIAVTSGESVSKGDTLLTFTNGETITAPYDAEIASIAVKSGGYASQGTILMRLTDDDDFTMPITRGTSTNSSAGEGGSAGGGSLTVDTIKVASGDKVTKGQAIASFTDGSLLLAPAAGTLTSLSLSTGGTISTSDAIAHITDYTHLLTTISVDELDISKVKVNQEAEITASAFEDETFKGKVTSVASSGSSENGTSSFDVKITITDPKSLKVGMSTEAKIVIESKDQALYVPVEAVYTKGDQKYVLVPSNNGESTKQVTVETGLTNDTYTEITKGLSEGDNVQVPQVKSSSNSSKGGMMMGGFGGGQGGDMPSGGPPSSENRGSGGNNGPSGSGQRGN